MKIHAHKPLQSLQVLAVTLAVAGAPRLCRAQEPQKLPEAALLDEDAIRGEKSLQASVSFEARRQKLPDVLAALSLQSGLKLSIAPGSPFESKRLTARASKMPLAQVLASLSRVYLASWSKRGQAFEMRSNGRSDLDNAQWKLNSTLGNILRAEQASPIDWSGEVARLGINRFQQLDGVAFSDLSPAIAQLWRSRTEDRQVVNLGLALGKLPEANLEGSTLRFWEDTPPGRFKLRLFTPEGKLVYDEFVPTPQDKPAPK